ncbi:MAG: outer membrane beta-barrel protein [Myxococcota bacterium]
MPHPFAKIARHSRWLVALLLVSAAPYPAHAQTKSDPEMGSVLERLRQLEEDLRETQTELEASKKREAERDARVIATEDALSEARQQVEDQKATLEEAGLVEDRGASFREAFNGSLSRFLSDTDFSGWVAGSYNYNIARNGNAGQAGQNSYLLFPNSNSIQFDQAWFSIDRNPTSESRTGFHIDIFAGQHAQILDIPTGGSEFGIYSAYISYLAPIFNGVRFDVGRLAAATGYETIEAFGNTHITRGLTFQFQPITNTGLRISADLSHGFSAILGVVNDAYARSLSGATNNPDIDLNAFKTLTAGLGWSGDSVSIAATGYFGREAILEPNANTPAHSGLVDLLILLTPNERLSLFLNSNAFIHPDRTDVGRFVSASVGGRFALLRDLGIALRGEWARTEGPNFALDDDVDVWSLTATGDYSITPDLLGKLEFRYDRSDESAFFDSGGQDESSLDYDQFVLLLQLLVGF